ncbi:MAG TPA: polysaccharide pyruvyl transferase family protein [Ignavibacteria bacterium]|nr:polysaccharide pyruvyl transferase family protein [Ignavibacteria bacterium]
MIKIFLSFDFYGAGNIGDDLMMDGFLKGLKYNDYEFYCSIPREPEHQRVRFPSVNFVEFKEREKTAASCGIWVGVGDTPVQIKSGKWFLQKLTADIELLRKGSKKYFMIGIGAEKEAVSEKEHYIKALERVDHFWTRDISTTDIIVNDFEIPAQKVTSSSDLANISLSKIFSSGNKVNKFKYDIGICYYDENAEEANLSALKQFLKKSGLMRKKLLFSNAVNKKGIYEFELYKKIFPMIDRLLYNVELYQPDYFSSGSINELLKHYTECETIMTSRYHSALTAAWAGSKVVILERSSKVSSLANELGIKEVKKPFTPDKLMEAYNNAVVTDPIILQEMLKRTSASVLDFEEIIRK